MMALASIMKATRKSVQDMEKRPHMMSAFGFSKAS
jgi:hypothetical protein